MTDLAHTRLEDAERVIAAGLATFVEVGNALMRIRNERLYADDFGTFEDYCRTRWGMSRQHASRMIDAAEITEALSPIGDILPASESQARELTGLEPEVAAEVMETAAEAGPVTAASIRDARAKITGQPTRPAEWVCDCGAHFKTEHTHCATCGAHYPAPTFCPEHTVSINGETGEILDGPSAAGRAAADRAPLPRIFKTPADHEHDRLVQQSTWIAKAVKHLGSFADPIALKRVLREWDPALADDNPADVNPSNLRAIADGLMTFANHLEDTRELRIV